MFAVIRRIDTDGDARLSFEEFADFFKTQVNENAELIRPKSKGLKRTHLMATDSKQGANIERLINDYGGRKSMTSIHGPRTVGL